MPAVTPQRVAAVTDGWSGAQKAELLRRVRAEAHRRHLAALYRSAGDLAQAVDPSTVQTPALRLVDDALEWALRTPGARLMVSMPSQQGKSLRLAVWGMIRALQLDPDRRVLVVTHSEQLARKHSRHARNIIASHGTGNKDGAVDKVGLALAPDSKAASQWSVRDHRGSVTARGITSALPGIPADLILVDDPHASWEEADSDALRQKVVDTWETAVKQRLRPGGQVVHIGTRWNERDLAGHLLAAEPGAWRVLNFPAIADGTTPDALGRAPGGWLESANGAPDWAAIKATTPERVWDAMYQGDPGGEVGDLFKSAWFDAYRTAAAPGGYSAAVVGVDPAETGLGDEAGVVVAVVDDAGTAWLVDDRSGHMTSDEWATAAALAAADWGASEIAVEGFAAATTYARAVETAIDALAGSGHPAFASGWRPSVVAWRAPGDDVARSTGLRQAVETGRCRTTPAMARFEQLARRWRRGQHCPDRVAAAVAAHDQLTTGRGSVQVADFAAAARRYRPRT